MANRSARFSVEAVFTAVDRVTAPINRMQANFLRATRTMHSGLSRLDNVASGLAKSVVGFGVKLVGGLTAAAAGFLGIATAANKATTEATLLAKAVQIDPSTASALAASVAGAGFEFDHVIDLVEELNNKMGESTALGVITPAAEALAILGLNFEKIKNLSPEKQFLAITNAALKMKNVSEAQAAVDILMGAEANKMMGVWKQRGMSMEEIITKYQRLNFLTDEGRDGAAKQASAMGTLGMAVASVKDEFFGLIGGAIEPYLNKLTDLIALHKENIHESMISGVQSLTNAIQWAIENWDLIIDRVKDFGEKALIIGKVLIGIKALTIAFGLFNAVLMLNPIFIIGSLIVAAVAGLVVMADKLGIISGISDTISKVWENIVGAIGKFIDKGKDLGGEYVQKFKGVFGFGDEDPAPAAVRKVDEMDVAEQRPSATARYGGGRSGQMVTPQERIARTISDTNTSTSTNAEVTIKDETGRAHKTGGGFGNNVRLVQSGAF